MPAVSERIPADDVAAAAERVVESLREASLAVVPTDTVYAVIADAFQPMATARLFGAKRRSRDLPLTVLLRSPRQVNGLVSEVPESADRLMASYWPGPLTVVFRASEGLTWDIGTSNGTVSLRLPADELLLAVAAEIGPLASSGANRSGEPVPHNADDAELQLGLTAAVYVDGGVREGPASTIVDVTRGFAEVLREGAIPAGHIAQVASGQVPWGARPEASGESLAHPAAGATEAAAEEDR